MRFDYNIEIARITFRVGGYSDEDDCPVIDTVNAGNPNVNIWPAIEGDTLANLIYDEAKDRLANDLADVNAELAATGGMGYDAVMDERRGAA